MMVPGEMSRGDFPIMFDISWLKTVYERESLVSEFNSQLDALAKLDSISPHPGTISLHRNGFPWMLIDLGMGLKM